jgi:hypothetical protein
MKAPLAYNAAEFAWAYEELACKKAVFVLLRPKISMDSAATLVQDVFAALYWYKIPFTVIICVSDGDVMNADISVIL